MTKVHDRDEFARLWAGPMTRREIAAHYRMTETGLRYVVKRFGLPPRKHRRGGANHTQKITIRGQQYDKQVDAARALNVTGAAISKAKARGALDSVGLTTPGRNGLPVTIDGKRYPTMTAAAKATGLSHSQIQTIRSYQEGSE